MTDKALPDPVLTMRGITKTFPGVKALSDVSLTVYAGEIHSLMGENGAGKSTLMKILSGAYFADPGGEICIDGKPVTIDGPLSSKALGVAVIYQELSLCPSLSVAENIYLGRELQSGGRTHRPARHGGRLQGHPRSTRRHVRPAHHRRRPVDCRASARRDRPRAAFAGPHPRHGRAHHAAFVARDRPSLRADPQAAQRRPGDRLHQSPHGGNLRTVGPRLGAARRHLCGHARS